MKRGFLQLYQILALLALIAIVALTVYLALQGTQLFIEAGTTEVPKFINVVNENESGFTVAWITTKNTKGSVILPEEGLTYTSNNDNTRTHVVEVNGLKAGRRYSFQLLSGTIVDDNQGVYYEAFTAKNKFSIDNKILFGRIFGLENNTPLSEGYITIHTETNGLITNKVYSILNEQGGWQLDYSNLLTQSLTDKFDPSQKTLLTLAIHSPNIAETVTRSYDLILNETIQIPDIYLGEDIPWELPAVEDDVMSEGI
mgnify:CR=1 FL=1|jgi:hypothetical protein